MTFAMSDPYSLDLPAMEAHSGVDLVAAFAALQALYDEVDARNARNTAGLGPPCHRGCSMCCHQSVFNTPLEFLFVWDYSQRHLDAAQRAEVVEAGRALYRAHRDKIDALNQPAPAGERDHFAIAKQIAFSCPWLSDAGAGACRVYPARESLTQFCNFLDRFHRSFLRPQDETGKPRRTASSSLTQLGKRFLISPHEKHEKHLTTSPSPGTT